MCASEGGIFVSLVRYRFGGRCTCAFRRCDNLGGGVRIRHRDISSQYTWEAAYVSVTVTSQASDLPRTHGFSVALSGRFPSLVISLLVL